MGVVLECLDWTGREVPAHVTNRRVSSMGHALQQTPCPPPPYRRLLSSSRVLDLATAVLESEPRSGLMMPLINVVNHVLIVLVCVINGVACTLAVLPLSVGLFSNESL